MVALVGLAIGVLVLAGHAADRRRPAVPRRVAVRLDRLGRAARHPAPRRHRAGRRAARARRQGRAGRVVVPALPRRSGSPSASCSGFDLPHRGWDALGDAVAAPRSIDAEPAARPRRGIARRRRRGPRLRRSACAAAGSRAGSSAWSALGVVGAVLGWLTVVADRRAGRAPRSASSSPSSPGRSSPASTWSAPASTARRSRRSSRPTQTIELTKETIEWVRARTPLVPKS